MSSLALLGGPSAVTGFSDATRWPVWDETDRQALGSVLERGQWWMYGNFKEATIGPKSSLVETFEQAFAKMHGIRHGIAVNSGSSALEICMRAIGLRPGDEVITTPYTFIATTSCILNHQAWPVYVDIDPETYNLDPRQVEAAITPRTRAILPVHFGGEICDMDALNAIAARHGLLVIEDAAHAHGAALAPSRHAGSLGLGGIFSFQESKNLTAGEGGLILTNDDAFAEACWSLRHYGRRRDGAWYAHYHLGWNGRMSEFTGSLLLNQLARLPEQQERRSRNLDALIARLADCPALLPMRFHPETVKRSVHLAMLRYQPAACGGLPRKRFLEALQAEGVPASPGYSHPLFANDMFPALGMGEPGSPFMAGRSAPVDYSLAPAQCPVAMRACHEEAVWLGQPLFLGSTDDLDQLAAAILKVYRHHGDLL